MIGLGIFFFFSEKGKVKRKKKIKIILPGIEIGEIYCWSCSNHHQILVCGSNSSPGRTEVSVVDLINVNIGKGYTWEES